MSDEDDKRDELERAFRALQDGTLPPGETYHVVHEFGEHNFREALPVVEPLVQSNDPQLCAVALDVIAGHWRMPGYWDIIVRRLTEDVDILCRSRAADLIGALKAGTGDQAALHLLAQVVSNTLEDCLVRNAAYGAMLWILNYAPLDVFRTSSPRFDPDRDVDWEVVKRHM
jgi:hypothetical protein